MSPMKTPLSQVKDQFGGKDKLVDKIMGLIERGEEDKDALRDRLLAASNSKLLRLAKISEAVKTKYGSTEKLVATVAQAVGKAKDADYVRRLGEYTPGKLLDMAQALAKRAGVAAKSAAGTVKAEAGKVRATAKAAATKGAGAAKAAAKTATKAAKPKKSE